MSPDTNFGKALKRQFSGDSGADRNSKIFVKSSQECSVQAPPFLSLRISLQMSRKSWRNMRPIYSQFIAEENLDFTTEKQTSRERAGMPKIYEIKKRD